MTNSILLSSSVSLAVGALGGYAAFYFRGAGARREQIAKSLADFYSSAAAVYYAARDHQRETGQDHFSYYKLFDQHYKEFLSASTLLASLVPPMLREEVLRLEDTWDEINDGGFATVPSKAWFDSLDNLRDRILNSIVYSSITDPFWRFVKNARR